MFSLAEARGRWLFDMFDHLGSFMMEWLNCQWHSHLGAWLKRCTTQPLLVKSKALVLRNCHRQTIKSVAKSFWIVALRRWVATLHKITLTSLIKCLRLTAVQSLFEFSPSFSKRHFQEQSLVLERRQWFPSSVKWHVPSIVVCLPWTVGTSIQFWKAVPVPVVHLRQTLYSTCYSQFWRWWLLSFRTLLIRLGPTINVGTNKARPESSRRNIEASKLFSLLDGCQHAFA